MSAPAPLRRAVRSAQSAGAAVLDETDGAAVLSIDRSDVGAVERAQLTQGLMAIVVRVFAEDSAA